MESALSISTTNTTLTLFTISRALNRHFFKRIPTTHRTTRPNTISTITLPFASLPRNSLGAVPPPQIRCRVDCMSSSAVSFGTGGGGDVGGGDGGGGGGSGGSDGGDSKSKLGGGGGEELSALPPDVIILDVGGMTCGGCAASVKRILESQPEVSSASVNLTTETAIVWPVSEAKVISNWQQQLGEALAKHLTSCGFESNLRDLGTDNFFKVFERKMDEKRNRLKESGRELAVSWTLCAVCLVGHLSHILGAKASWIHVFHSTGFHLSLSLFTLLGPGLQLILDGVKSLFKGAPNMNTLVGLGALSSFTVSSLATFLPKLDRVPADGIVRAGRSTIDESSFTGEPLPVTKVPGSQVAAGSINLNGTLTIELRRPGGETAMGDIVRLVEEAQSREAPVQRLADKVSGHFTYGVMALSAATFMFWNLFGARILPASIYHGSLVSLALQLSCSVLVVACPCALGLATPTAMLVGTSLGATRGLLLRGGNILEKFSMVNTVVFDKTGTLTIGRPVVTKVVTSGILTHPNSKQNPIDPWSEIEVLKLAAGVESNTVHPIGKAIVEAARVANCPKVKVVDGTFIEEPGSGAVAVIENRKVSVGTIDWVCRHGVDASLFQEVEMEELKNQSHVYIGVDNMLAGLICVEDQIREDAALVVKSLSRQGIGVYMLSGDKRSSAEYVASLVGIPKEKVLSGVKPDEKKRFINELQKDQNIVAMVGDGINDAAALASSHIGVAMGGGVGAASEVSSVVLMGNRLSQFLDALELSRLTMKTVKQNLWWAFGYNIVGIPIAAGMLLPVTGTMLTPSIAGALMGLSSIGVMANSLLLRLKFSLKHRESFEAPSHIKSNFNSHQLVDLKKKKKHPSSDDDGVDARHPSS